MSPESISEDYNVSSSGPVALTLPPGCAGQRLDQVLSNLLPEYSRSRLARWIRDGHVQVNGLLAQPKTKVWGSEKVTVHPVADPSTQPAAAEAIALDIIHEDAAILVIAKPAGLVVHPGKGNWSGTMLNALLAHAPELAALPRAGIVHRLDKDTSGLLVVAKTLIAQTSLVRQLQARTVKRLYLALVHGRIDHGSTVDAPIGRHPAERTRMAIVASGKPAVTHFEVLQHYAHATLLRCRLETGRTHQIRVHLQSLGHPLVGDPVYGRNRKSAGPAITRFARQALHAEQLAFLHPESGELVSWSNALPADMQTLLEALQPEAD